MIEKFDDKEGYCRMLGHVIPFKYCRTANYRLPCHKILDCWFNRLPVQQFVAENYSPEEQQSIFEPPPPKMVSIAGIVEKVRKKKGRETNEKC